jgi:hypothetical protein
LFPLLLRSTVCADLVCQRDVKLHGNEDTHAVAYSQLDLQNAQLHGKIKHMNKGCSVVCGVTLCVGIKTSHAALQAPARKQGSSGIRWQKQCRQISIISIISSRSSNISEKSLSFKQPRCIVLQLRNRMRPPDTTHR